MLVYQVEEDYAAVVESLATRFVTYVPASDDPEPGYPATVTRYFPFVFGNEWPLLAIKELPPVMGRPESTSDTDCLVQAVRFAIFVYYPSLTRPDLGADYVDGREAADRITTAVWSRWIKGLQDDTGLFANIARVEISIDANDKDALGVPYFASDTEDTSILWIRATEVSLYL